MHGDQKICEANKVIEVKMSYMDEEVYYYALKQRIWRKKYKLENYVIHSLPANSVVEKNINDIDAVGDCIASAVGILKPSSKDAAVAVAGSTVITKTIEMNAALSDSEMESQIVVEADQYIPYPLDEVSIDFERQELSERSPEMVEVLLAAVSRQP